MLLTRAPVAARSIATSALPLDLHVLGLSLAFILSQDQTLRCISCFSFLYLRRTPGRIDFVLFSLVLHLLLFSLVNELYFVFPSPDFSALSRSESDAKIHPFSFPFQIFQELFFKKISTYPSDFVQPFYLLIVIKGYRV